MTEIRLTKHEKLIVRWVRNELLLLETWQIANHIDGHGWLLRHQSILTGNDLEQFLTAILPPPAAEENAA